MPPKRRSPTGPATKSSQSTLAFHGTSNKVSKPSTRSSLPSKKSLLDIPTLPQSSDIVEPISVDDPTSPDLTTADSAILSQARQEAAAQVSTQPPEDAEARRVTEARIEKYWAGKEKSRKTPRVHQEQLSLYEKVLREWDMRGEYGPCIGIARLKRWKRAHRLGLNPPIEVLAVLLKEQDGNNFAAQRAHVDELMSSRFVET